MNSENKPELVFTFPAALGGVASFNYNLINYSTLKNKFRIKVILLKAKEDTRVEFSEKFKVQECIHFEYSNKDNQYFVLKRLNMIIGTNEGAVICDNSLTLQACSIFKNPKTVFHILHDYFYVNQNIALEHAIDVSIAHSSFFSDCVFASNPKEFAEYSFYIPYGVKQYSVIPTKSKNERLKLFFLGRLAEGKGIEKLFLIEKELQLINISVDWTIIGTGPLKEMLLKSWEGKSNVLFAEPNTTEEVFITLKNQDIFIFPTEFEGTPVSIIEALSNGCVTIVTNLPGGIRDLVTDDVGFKVPIKDIVSYVQIIKDLDADRDKLLFLQHNSWLKAKYNYDIEKNADEYFKLFSDFTILKRNKKIINSINLSKLDKPYFPNFLVKIVRTFK
jgi:glycosyltransferase involved in cell wall biosynthesis